MTSPIKTRFMNKFIPEPNSGCWLWIGSLSSKGYGVIRLGNKAAYAHRISWEVHNDKIPRKEGSSMICVLHKCDNTACVNPSHLFLGTRADNNVDKSKKGRASRLQGEINSNSKLTNEQVLLIRKLGTLKGKAHWTQKTIGKMFGISEHTVYLIKNLKSWKHL